CHRARAPAGGQGGGRSRRGRASAVAERQGPPPARIKRALSSCGASVAGFYLTTSHQQRTGDSRRELLELGGKGCALRVTYMRARILLVPAALAVAQACASLPQIGRLVQPVRFEADERGNEVRLLAPRSGSPLGAAGIRLWTRGANPHRV